MAWRKRFFPRQVHERTGFLILNSGLPVILWFGLQRVLPVLFEEYPDFQLAQSVFLICLFLNTEISLWLTVLRDSSIHTVKEKLPAVLKSGWKYCSYCEVNSPPRSSHCFACSCCILRRDHHCVFTGCCIGYNNHRPFLSFVLSFWFGSFYAIVLVMFFVRHVVHHFTFSTLFSVILPVPAYLLGYMEGISFLTGTMSALSIVSLISSSAMLYSQILHVFRGQTAYERKHRITNYQQGWKRNLAEICGARWYVALFSPLIPSPMNGDGTHFSAEGYSKGEDIKDV